MNTHAKDPCDSVALEMLERLVSFNTISDRTNLPLIEWVEAMLAPHHVRVERIEGAGDGKACLWVTFGDPNARGYVLSGHSDVVPVEGQAWTADPFRLRRDARRLYGRGTADMKGFVAVCLAHAREMAEAPLTRPIHLAISYDEEIGCKGVRILLERIADRTPAPLGCFVGEPTEMRAVHGHKGKKAFRAVFEGTAGHTSRAPDHVNAVEWGARLVGKIRSIGDDLATDGDRDQLYDVSFSTLVTTSMRGGSASNIVPDRCEIEWECRSISAAEGDRIDKAVLTYISTVLEPAMRLRRPEAKIRIDKTTDYPGLHSEATRPVVGLARSLGLPGPPMKVAFGTEAGLFESIARIPAVVIGPGSIEQAHKPDEYIEEEQLAHCGNFVRRLIAHCCADQ